MTWTGFDYSEQRLLWGLLGRDLPDDSRLECNLYGVRMAASGEPQLRMTMSQRRALIKPIAAHPDRGRRERANPPGASGNPAHRGGFQVPIGRKVRRSWARRQPPGPGRSPGLSDQGVSWGHVCTPGVGVLLGVQG